MSFQQYRDARRPDCIWLVTSSVISFSIIFCDSILFDYQFHKWLLGTDKDIGRVIFVYYCIIFVIFWIVYFLSRQLGVQSLRVLLIYTSRQWANRNTSSKQEQEAENQEILVDEYRKKGEATITSQSILIAISTILIVEIYRRRNDIVAKALHDPWESTLLNAGMFFAVVAFILLIYAVDCMDTMFNSFKEKKLDMIHYFYAISFRPKYYGMLCVIVAFILLVGSFAPNMGSFGIGVLLLVGYKFWYPDLDLSNNIFKWNSFSFLFRVTMCVVPLAVTLRYGDGF